MPKFFKKNKFTIDIMSYNTYHGTKRTQKKNIVKFEYEYNVNFKNIHQFLTINDRSSIKLLMIDLLMHYL